MATALLVIDVQQSLVDDLAAERRAEFLGTLGTLIDRARSAGYPLVYVRHDGGPDELTPGTQGWEIANAIAPHEGEPIIDKRSASSFHETGLADVLSGVHADHLVISGMQTDYCVAATLRDAAQRGYRVTLVEDAHATYASNGNTEEEIRERLNGDARNGLATVAPAAELFTSQPASFAANEASTN